MPLDSSTPSEATATAVSTSQAQIVRHGWVALVRASRSVNEAVLPACPPEPRFLNSLISVPHFT